MPSEAMSKLSFKCLKKFIIYIRIILQVELSFTRLVPLPQDLDLPLRALALASGGDGKVDVTSADHLRDGQLEVEPRSMQ